MSRWYKQAYTKKKALAKEIDLSTSALEASLETNNRDIDKTPILELGYSFSAWNGDLVHSASISMSCGSYHDSITNCCILRAPDFNESEIQIQIVQYKPLFDLFVSCWEPDHCIATSRQEIASSIGKKPWDSPAWFTYSKF